MYESSACSGAGVARALHRVERVARRRPGTRPRRARELRELAGRQHVARRLEVAGLVERVVARDDRAAERALEAVERRGDAGDPARVVDVVRSVGAEVVLAEVVGQDQAVLEEAASVTTHSAVGSPLSP